MRPFRVLLFALAFVFLLTAGQATTLTAGELRLYETIGGDFTLTGPDGKPVSLNDFRGKAVMLFFGFLNCPEVCPTTLLTMKKVRQKLGKSADRFQVIFITLDPERDEPVMMGQYVSHFHKSFLGLTGNKEQIGKVAKLYHVGFKKVPIKETYTIAHTDVLYLLDQQGRTRGLYQRNDTIEQIVKDINSLFATL